MWIGMFLPGFPCSYQTSQTTALYSSSLNLSQEVTSSRETPMGSKNLNVIDKFVQLPMGSRFLKSRQGESRAVWLCRSISRQNTHHPHQPVSFCSHSSGSGGIRPLQWNYNGLMVQRLFVGEAGLTVLCFYFLLPGMPRPMPKGSADRSCTTAGVSRTQVSFGHDRNSCVNKWLNGATFSSDTNGSQGFP